MPTALAGQLDLLALVEDAKLSAPAPTLYGSAARGLAARAAEFTAWRDAHGSFGSFGRHITRPDTPTGRCQPTVLSADLRCDCDRHEGCCCVGELMYRGACRHCDWEGEPRERENTAAEDACEHAWPGWRDVPVVPRVPEERSKRAAWVDRVRELYPAGWLEDGGPIRTARSGYGTRHVPSRTPFDGYDMAVVDRDEDDES
jgi:hypothetical protein